MMLNRSGLIFVVALAVGCNSSAPPDAAPTAGQTAADPQPAGPGESHGLWHVAFYLPGMNQKLNIL